MMNLMNIRKSSDTECCGNISNLGSILTRELPVMLILLMSIFLFTVLMSENGRCTVFEPQDLSPGVYTYADESFSRQVVFFRANDTVYVKATNTVNYNGTISGVCVNLNMTQSNQINFVLYDNGHYPDEEKNDGIYTGMFNLTFEQTDDTQDRLHAEHYNYISIGVRFNDTDLKETQIYIDDRAPRIVSVNVYSSDGMHFYSNLSSPDNERGSVSDELGVVWYQSKWGEGAGQIITLEVNWYDEHPWCYNASAILGGSAYYMVENEGSIVLQWEVAANDSNEYELVLEVMDQTYYKDVINLSLIHI